MPILIRTRNENSALSELPSDCKKWCGFFFFNFAFNVLQKLIFIEALKFPPLAKSWDAQSIIVIEHEEAGLNVNKTKDVKSGNRAQG